MGKKAFMNQRKLFSGSLNLDLLNRIIKCFGWSVALYAAETWAVTKADKKLQEAFEIRIWRQGWHFTQVKLVLPSPVG